MPDLAVIHAGIILIALMIYALSGGADFGAGMWDLFASGKSARKQREVIADTIAPIWEANHVWLILVVVLLFTIFPSAFAAMMIDLHIPLTIVLIGIVLRGSAFVFRKYGVQKPEDHQLWSTIFGVSSLVTPFFLGIVLGAVSTGDIRVEEGVTRIDLIGSWLTPYALLCGLFAQTIFAFLAAAYLADDHREDVDLRAVFRSRALLSGLMVYPLALVLFFVAKDGAPNIYHELTDTWGLVLIVATGAVTSITVLSLWQDRPRIARLGAMAQVSLILLGWGIAQYPYMIYPDLTISGTAGPDVTLELVLVALIVGFIVLIPSLFYLFYIFRQDNPQADET
jgi:cytochrome d ubiquinol oxidase subunit II